jgi:hypothetical protein
MVEASEFVTDHLEYPGAVLRVVGCHALTKPVLRVALLPARGLF